MCLWKTCGKPVNKAVDNFEQKVIHNLVHTYFHRFSTGFAQAFFLFKPIKPAACELIPKNSFATTITTILKI